MSDQPPSNDAAAFRWLDEFFYIPVDQGSPDEAFDWIFMMHEEDWRLLAQVWAERPSNWRESCAYILGSGPVPESLPLLRRALFDNCLDVAVQAACAFAGQRLDNGDLVEIDGEVFQRLQELVDSAGGEHMEEVIEVLQRFHWN